MPKSTLTWYISKARRIMRSVRGIKQKLICIELNESAAVISYRMKNVYEKELIDWVRILDLAGYKIVEKGEDE